MIATHNVNDYHNRRWRSTRRRVSVSGQWGQEWCRAGQGRLLAGPLGLSNLGCNFTLCCPFTLLAHYQELDFAERCGISRYLLRVAVGLEEPEWLIERFNRALAVA